VLRALLLSGGAARYLESAPSGGSGEAPAARVALWEPTSKVFGRYLLPYLQQKVGRDQPEPPQDARIAVEVDLESTAASPDRR
jgi:hypothetical protein